MYFIGIVVLCLFLRWLELRPTKPWVPGE